MSHDFKKLRIWEVSMATCKDIYIATRNFPKEEVFWITSQLRRAASSVAANIAEWSARWTKKDFSHFISMAHGSVNEVQTFLILAKDLDYLTEQESSLLLDQYYKLANMLALFQKTLH